MMRVLHCPEDIAGQAGEYSYALRKARIKSDLLTYHKHPFGYKENFCLNIRVSWDRRLKLPINFLRVIPRYDIFHFHFNKTLFSKHQDLPILKLLGKKLVFQFWGCDVRLKKINTKKYKWSMCKYCELNCSDASKERNLSQIKKYADALIVGDTVFEEIIPEAYVIPICLNLENYPYVFPNYKEKLLIVHAPSKRMIKGTEKILEAINELKKEYRFEFKLIENMDHPQAIQIYKKADIIVDQLYSESHGILSLEGMALGKPVLCNIGARDLEKSYKPDLPVLCTNPENLYHNLELLIKNRELRVSLGKEGREYVEKYHDSKKVVKELIKLYRRL